MIMGPFYRALRMTTDVYGKASRIEALGGKAVYVGNTYEVYAENYWSMFAKNLWKSYKGIVTGSVEMIDAMPSNGEGLQFQADLTSLQTKVKTLRENDAIDANKVDLNAEVAAIRDGLDNQCFDLKGKILVRAAGYNARMAHTRNIEDTVWYDGGGHLTQLSNHTINKLAYTVDSIGLLFQRNESGKANSELGRIEAAYKTMGIELSWKEMGMYGAFSFLGSAEFWARFFEEVDYISSGDTYVKSPEIGGFRLPNLGFYLTTQGPSYQVNTGYRWGQDLFFPFAVEFVFKGPNKMVEIITGIRKQFAWMNAYIHCDIVANTHNTAFGGKVMVGLKPLANLFVDIGVRFDNMKTLDGERNIRSLEKDTTWCPSVMATIGILF
jgi:hypothetical protein